MSPRQPSEVNLSSALGVAASSLLAPRLVLPHRSVILVLHFSPTFESETVSNRLLVRRPHLVSWLGPFAAG